MSTSLARVSRAATDNHPTNTAVTLRFQLGIGIYRLVSELIGPPTFLRLLPAVMVLEADDIVLAEIAP